MFSKNVRMKYTSSNETPLSVAENGFVKPSTSH